MMSYLSEFRELYDELHEGESRQVAPLLRDWSSRHSAILEPYRKFQQLNVLENIYEVAGFELSALYALSRVCDTLLLPFQVGEIWFDLTLDESADFWQKLGIQAREPREFHPFWCEIVACENIEDASAPPRIKELFWPALMWGDLLICRAGVRLCVGRNWIDASVAASSKLYFTSRRNYRDVEDLSHGWGSNSQWNTSFRRDYVWKERYVFNADGERAEDEPFLRRLSAHQWAELLKTPRQFFTSENGDFGDLTLAEREELLVNRCLIRNDRGDADNFWPYDDVAVWQQAAPLSPAEIR